MAVLHDLQQLWQGIPNRWHSVHHRQAPRCPRDYIGEPQSDASQP